MRSRGRAPAIGAACVLLARGALAQAPPEPSGDAEAKALTLFKDAIAALEKEDWASACPRFVAALKLYPSPSTQLNIAKCLEHEGKIASAWAAYQHVLVLNHATKDQKRREALEALAKAGAAALENALPRYRIVAPNPPPGLRVREGDQELPGASFGVALPTDPGPHQFVASAPGYEDLRVDATAEKSKQFDVLVVLKPVAKPSGTGTVGPTPVDRPPSPEPPKPPEPRRAPAWAWATGGIGLVALGVGAGLGAVALSKQNAIAAACGMSFPHCAMSAQGAVQPLVDARNAYRGAFAGMAAVGVVGIGAGVIGIATAGSAKKDDRPQAAGLVVSPFASPGGGGLFARGAF